MNGKQDTNNESLDVLIPLAQHVRPSRPTTNELLALLKKAMLLFRDNHEEPFIASDKLHRTAATLLDEVAPPPAFGNLTKGLERSFRTWFATNTPQNRVRVVVVPPADANGLIETWAEEFGYEILPAPAREEIEQGQAEVPDLQGEGVLVIPHLEHWFFRSHDGLKTVRNLLNAIDRSSRKIVVGCDSWAWEFLSKAAAAHLILPDPQTLRPFDGKMLAVWFSELMADSGMKNLRFRQSSTGNDLLSMDDGTEDEPLNSDFFRELAASSRGIPWVAWSLWRGSLRLEQVENDEENTPLAKQESLHDREVLWVASLEEFSLPDEHKDTALLVLHALLLHGQLTRDELSRLLPMKGAGDILPALLRTDFIQQRHGMFSCGSATYPSIRTGLATAGFSLDKL